MPKKPPKGPFFFFMLEFRDNQRAAGKNISGNMVQLQQLASPHWNKLSKEERKPYEERAKQHKKEAKDEPYEKYSSQGVPLSLIEKQQQEHIEKIRSIENKICSSLQRSYATDSLDKLDMFFIAANYFCCTIDKQYVPAELGLVKFNLAKGIVDQLHILVSHRQLPLGMAYDAQCHADETHQLPTPPNALGEQDFEVILVKIVEFIQGSNKDVPILFTHRDDIPIVENILQQFCDESQHENPFKVYNITYLLFKLKENTMKLGLELQNNFATIHVAHTVIEKDSYEYTKGISCKIHEENAAVKYCALSRCKRWAFIFSDNCAPDLSIDLQPGKHVPSDCDTTMKLDLNSTCYTQSDFDKESVVSSSVLSNVTKANVQTVKCEDYYSRNSNNSHANSSASQWAKFKSDADETRSFANDFPSLSETMNSTNPFHRTNDSHTNSKKKKNRNNSFGRTDNVSVDVKPNSNPFADGRKSPESTTTNASFASLTAHIKGRGRGLPIANVVLPSSSRSTGGRGVNPARKF
uniref:Putative hmg box-containing protein n=1 Tax=Corethrella appendiculata TaxID=1370023 RepID=U5EVE7_9DIPT